VEVPQAAVGPQHVALHGGQHDLPEEQDVPRAALEQQVAGVGVDRPAQPGGQQIADRLGLKHRIAPASDPFFGRAAKLMADNQIEQALKFELLIVVRSAEQPTACMSFNCHRDHFGTKWGLRDEAGDVTHTACAAFGMDRLALALFATHGTELYRWPRRVREALSI